MSRLRGVCTAEGFGVCPLSLEMQGDPTALVRVRKKGPRSRALEKSDLFQNRESLGEASRSTRLIWPGQKASSHEGFYVWRPIR
jgi:hypothetical protein